MYAVAVLMISLTALAGARIYERCELARDLQVLGIDKDQIATWVCIAYHESRFDTAAQNHGSGDHGLLQISQLYWCGPGKACGAPCSAFRDEDISDDVKCALQIYKEHTRLQGDGFLAWVVYPHHCKQNAKKYIVDCDKNIKNTPVKFDDRTRYFKASSIKNETKSQVVNIPFRNPVTPRYLSINSIFQGSYVDEFEKNYYSNNKQSNWQNFKLDNIDDLKLPGDVSKSYRSRFIEFTTRPTISTTTDPALKGIKPPSPRKIETNQFRRKKTFSEPLFLKNRFSVDQKISPTTLAPVRESVKSSSSGFEDLSHNIFLNLSPSVISKSLREFSSQPIKPNDFSPYHVKTSLAEESSSSAVITLDDLAQNPFLNSLPGFSNLKSRTESPFRATNHYSPLRPVSKQDEYLRNLEVDSNIPESSKTSSQINEDDTKISIADLALNPFLSRFLSGNKINPSTDSAKYEVKYPDGNYKKDVTYTTVKPTTALVFSFYPNEQSEITTKIPTTVQRGRARYFTDYDNTITEKPITERSTTVAYSTRRYQTISRQRSNTNQNDLKSTAAIELSTEKPKVSATSKSYNNFKIETTPPKTTTTGTMSGISYNETKVNKFAVELQKDSIPLNYTRTETTSRPGITSRIKTALNTETTTTTSRPQITYGVQTARPWTANSVQVTSTSETTSRPVTTRKPETTSRPTTLWSLSTKRFWEKSRNLHVNYTLTTPRPSFTWRRPTNSTVTSTTQYATTLQSPSTTPRSSFTWRRLTNSNMTSTTQYATTLQSPSTTPRSGFTWKWPSNSTVTSTTQYTTTLKSPSTTPRSTFTWRRPTNSTITSTTQYATTLQSPSTTPRSGFTWKWPSNSTVTSTTQYATTLKSQSTTPRSSFTWRRPTNSTITSTTQYATTLQSPSTTPRSSFTWRRPTNSTITSTTQYAITLQSPSTTPRSIFTWRRPTNSTVTATTQHATTLQSPSTTPRSSFTWNRPTNSNVTFTTQYATTLQSPSKTSTEASTAKTTLSIFDLYLRPSTQPSFKPFQFTSSNSKLHKIISIFSGGTTKPPPAYFTSKKPVQGEVLKP